MFDMAKEAARRGAKIFGLSDHAPLFAHAEDHPLPGTQMARSSWSDYLGGAHEVRGALEGELDVRVGVEADWLPGTEATYKEALLGAPLDYVIGSVHTIGDVKIFGRETFALIEDVDELHRDYWRLVRGAAESGLFDILAHIDACKTRLPQPNADMSGEIGETLDCIADTGVTVEINSKGLRKVGEYYPAPGILEGLVRRGVPLTFGSDSHRVSEVAYGYERAARKLERLGVDSLVAFRERQAERVSL